MKLLLATPWNDISSNARMAVDVTRALMDGGHEVEVLRTETGADRLRPARSMIVPVHQADERSAQEWARSCDCVIINLGNHFGFHGAAWKLIEQATPLILLHDASMAGFIHGWRESAESDAGDWDHFLAGLDQDGTGIAPFCALAAGVVVHGPHYRAVAEAACPGPVASIPVECSADPVVPPRAIGDRLVVLTIGHMNRNKRVEEVIRAIGSSDRLRSRVQYVLAGAIESHERERLLTLARRYRAPEPYFVSGWVPDPIMTALIGGADVICCLRFPALEGGSGSMITAMLSGRPTLVSNHASYAELPDGLVMKCAPGDEAADVRRHLEAILDDPQSAQAMGQRAREYAAATFSAASYTARLLPMIERTVRAMPFVRAAHGVGGRLAELGVRPGDPAVDRLDRLLRETLPSVGGDDAG